MKYAANVNTAPVQISALWVGQAQESHLTQTRASSENFDRKTHLHVTLSVLPT